MLSGVKGSHQFLVALLQGTVSLQHLTAKSITAVATLLGE